MRDHVSGLDATGDKWVSSVARRAIEQLCCLQLWLGRQGWQALSGEAQEIVADALLLHNDPDHWRQRAEQMRALANDAKDEDAKQAILRIARDYDLLAVRAEQRSKGSPQSM